MNATTSNIDESDIQSLCDTLWATETDPSVPRILNDDQKAWLGPYFHFCTPLLKDLVEKDAPGYSPADRQQEIRSALRQLRSHPHTTKEALRTLIRGTRDNNVSNNAQIDKSIAFAVKMMLMVNCAHPVKDSGRNLEEGRARVFWMDGPQNTFTAFIDHNLFPLTSEATRDKHPLGYHHNPDYSQAILQLRVRKLKKTLDVSFVPTSNLAGHLKYDEERRKVYVFHHVGFLKLQLDLTRGVFPTNGPEESTRLGAVPRRLAIEVLLSLQVVLFPLGEEKSMALLDQVMESKKTDGTLKSRNAILPPFSKRMRG